MTEQPAQPHPDRNPSEPDDLPEQLKIRRDKRARLLSNGDDPYPVSVARTATLAEVRAAHENLETGESSGVVVGVAGRVVHIRIGGKLCFGTLQDGDGTRLQVMISLDGVGEERLAAFKADVDLGDLILVHGEVISSRRGELSVLADAWSMTAKRCARCRTCTPTCPRRAGSGSVTWT